MRYTDKETGFDPSLLIFQLIIYYLNVNQSKTIH